MTRRASATTAIGSRVVCITTFIEDSGHWSYGAQNCGRVVCASDDCFTSATMPMMSPSSCSPSWPQPKVTCLPMGSSPGKNFFGGGLGDQHHLDARRRGLSAVNPRPFTTGIAMALK